MTWTFQRHDNSSATKPKTHTHTEKEKHTNHKIRHKRINTHNTETFFVVLYEGHTVHTLCFFALFRCCALERSLSLDLDTTEPEGNPEGRGRNPYFHTHTYTRTHIHKHFSVSSLFHLQHSLSSPFVFFLLLLLLLSSSSSLSYLLLPLSPALVPDRGDDKAALNGDKQP